MDPLPKFEDANPLKDYGHCIIKEELIISETDDEEEEIDVETVDDTCNELLINLKFSSVQKSVKEPITDENTKTGEVPTEQLSLRPGHPTINEDKISQATPKQSEPLERVTSNDHNDAFVAIVEPDLNTAMKNLTKSHCKICNKKAKVVPRKARCSKCHRSLSYICENCEKPFKSYHTLCYHLKANHITVVSPPKCAKCNRSFVQRTNMLAHRRICGREPAYGCSKCAYRAYYKSNLIKHLEEKHSGRVFDCKKCAKVFSNRRSLNRHARCYCGKKRSLQCHHCKHKVYRKDHMIGHIARVHMEVYGEKEKVARNCEFCGAILKRFEHMRHHLERCELAPAELCRRGDKADQLDLETAMKNLAKARCARCKKNRPVIRGLARCKDCKIPLTYSCESCRKTWPNSTALREHLKAKHVKHIAYHRCDKCDCSYTHKKHLAIHQRLRHSREVVVGGGFQCSRCEKECDNESSMTKHRKVCGREPKFCCDLCSYKTHFKSSLLRHFRGKHAACRSKFN